MKTITQVTLIVFLLSLLVLGIATLLQAQGLLPTDLTLLLTDPTIQLNAVMLSPDTTATASPARDPGVRGGPAGAGGAIVGLTARELEFFNTGQADFESVEAVGDAPLDRLVVARLEMQAAHELRRTPIAAPQRARVVHVESRAQRLVVAQPEHQQQVRRERRADALEERT